MTRQTKTPAQRAQEAYDTAVRIAARLEKRRKAMATELKALEAEYTAAVRRRDHLATHPDLPKQNTTTPSTPSGDTA